MKSAICLIVRNESRDIAEWIAFHALAGFDTQIIFDNRSDDGTTGIIKAASTLHDIRYHLWNDSSVHSQVSAYWAACEAYRPEFDWIAFIDSDEFVMLPQAQQINAFLERFDGWSAIALNWAIYGSSAHEDYPDGLVLDSFTRRAPADFFATRHVKSIIRPGFAARCLNPHCFDMRGNTLGSYADARARTMQWWVAPELGGIAPGLSLEEPDYTQARVNHYFTRSKAHWMAKLRRGYPSDVAIRKMEEFDIYNRNEVEDPVAPDIMPALRLEISRIEAAVQAGMLPGPG